MRSEDAGWYAALPDGQARGPLSRAALLALRERGEIGDDTPVWSLEWSEWAPLKRLSAAGHGQAGLPVPAPARSSRTPVVTLAPARAGHPGQTQLSADLQARINALGWSPPAPAPAPAPAAAAAPASPAARAPGTSPHPAARPTTPLQALRVPADRAGSTADRIQDQERVQGARLVIGIRRFLARAIDLGLLGGVGYTVLHLVQWRFGLWLLPSPAALWDLYAGFALLALGLVLLPLEMLVTATGAPTPGKWLFGLRIRRERRAWLGAVAIALRRPGMVLAQGQALLLPLLSLITAGVAMRALVIRGNCEWDDRLGTTVAALSLPAQRWGVGLVVLAACWAMTLSGGWDMLSPAFW